MYRSLIFLENIILGKKKELNRQFFFLYQKYIKEVSKKCHI